MTEFAVIQDYFANWQQADADLILGIGDDAAIVQVPNSQQLVISCDSLIAGVHFPENTTPEDIAYKALAVNLSDLAAMGAVPHWFTLALSLPALDESWLKRFSCGLAQAAAQYEVCLIGGDTTKGGPLAITITVHGLLPQGTGLRRAGAKIGDEIYVTGELGGAGLALQQLQTEGVIKTPELACALYSPSPQLALGAWLRDKASSAIDISDGLLADLGHILAASHCGASLDLSLIPVPRALLALDDDTLRWRLALTAGDDYQLCFTIPQAQAGALRDRGCTRIGVIEATKGVRFYGGIAPSFAVQGYQHFTNMGEL